MNQSLAQLYLRRLISLEEALAHSSEPEELQQIIASGGVKPGGRGSAGGRGPGGRE
jgi:hypothetical protein